MTLRSTHSALAAVINAVLPVLCIKSCAFEVRTFSPIGRVVFEPGMAGQNIGGIEDEFGVSPLITIDHASAQRDDVIAGWCAGVKHGAPR